LFRLLDFGDIVGAEGHLFRTKTNELTIWASRLEFLSKCFIPLPEKWHGLQDVETRYRQRYLDLLVNEEARADTGLRAPIGRKLTDLHRRHLGAKMRNAGQEISLTPREYDLLEGLAAREGEVLTRELIQERIWHEAEPVYEEHSGWQTSTQGLREYAELPAKARAYLERLSELIGVGFGVVSTGPERDETILMPDSPLTRWYPSLRGSIPPR